MPNLDLIRKDDVSSFRKIAIGTWADAVWAIRFYESTPFTS